MLVSLIIPTYNVEQYVAEALDSSIAQTYRPIEIIAVDNNSTDGTLGILHNYAQRFPDLITVLQEPKQGAPAARNLGLKYAKGEWIQFLDADDILLPGKVERQVGMLSDNSGASMIWGGYKRQYLENREESRVPLRKIWEALVGAYAGNTPSNLWHINTLLEINGWDESWESCQDYKLIFDVLKENEQVLIDSSVGVIVRERREGGQISDQDWSVIIRNEIRLRIQVVDFLISKGIKISDELWQRFFRYIRMYAGEHRIHALALYEEHFPKSLRLKYKGGSKCSLLYVMLFNMMGYSKLEILKSAFKERFLGKFSLRVFQFIVNGK